MKGGRQRGATGVYVAYQAVSGFGFYLYAAAFSLYLIQRVGLSPFELVLTGTVLEISVTLGEVPTGVVADTVSRRLSVLVGLVLMGIGFTMTAVPNYAVILASQVLWGIGFTFTSGADIAWITDEIGEERARPLYVRAAQARFVATLLGLGIGAGLGTVALWIPMVLGGAVVVALAAVLAPLMPETGFVGPGLKAAGDRNPFHALADTVGQARAMVNARRVLLLIVIVALTFGFGSEAFDRLWQLHLLDDVGLPGGEPILWLTGLHMGALLLATGGAEVVRRRADLHSRRGAQRATLGVLVVVLVLMVVFATAPVFAVAAAAYVGVTAARGVAKPVLEAWVNQGLDSRSRATVNSFVSQANAVGELSAGPVFGGVAQWVSVPVAIAGAGLVHGPAIAVLATKTGEEPQAEPVVATEPSAI